MKGHSIATGALSCDCMGMTRGKVTESCFPALSLTVSPCPDLTTEYHRAALPVAPPEASQCRLSEETRKGKGLFSRPRSISRGEMLHVVSTHTVYTGVTYCSKITMSAFPFYSRTPHTSPGRCLPVRESAFLEEEAAKKVGPGSKRQLPPPPPSLCCVLR